MEHLHKTGEFIFPEYKNTEEETKSLESSFDLKI